MLNGDIFCLIMYSCYLFKLRKYRAWKEAGIKKAVSTVLSWVYVYLELKVILITYLRQFSEVRFKGQIPKIDKMHWLVFLHVSHIYSIIKRINIIAHISEIIAPPLKLGINQYLIFCSNSLISNFCFLTSSSRMRSSRDLVSVLSLSLFNFTYLVVFINTESAKYRQQLFDTVPLTLSRLSLLHFNIFIIINEAMI